MSTVRLDRVLESSIFRGWQLSNFMCTDILLKNFKIMMFLLWTCFPYPPKCSYKQVWRKWLETLFLGAGRCPTLCVQIIFFFTFSIFCSLCTWFLFPLWGGASLNIGSALVGWFDICFCKLKVFKTLFVRKRSKKRL